jgi:Holliday junction resolvase-like predicted endonuclease
MNIKLSCYDDDFAALDKEAPDYHEKLRAWSEAALAAQDATWAALCEVLYAAHYKMMETCGGYAVDHAAVDRLDAAIETILEAMPDWAKTRFDVLMQRPCER